MIVPVSTPKISFGRNRDQDRDQKHRFRSCLVIVYIPAGNLEITDTAKNHTAYLAGKYIIKNRNQKVSLTETGTKKHCIRSCLVSALIFALENRRYLMAISNLFLLYSILFSSLL
jgi:hypothetical protein